MDTAHEVVEVDDRSTEQHKNDSDNEQDYKGGLLIGNYEGGMNCCVRELGDC